MLANGTALKKQTLTIADIVNASFGLLFRIMVTLLW